MYLRKLELSDIPHVLSMTDYVRPADSMCTLFDRAMERGTNVSADNIDALELAIFSDSDEFMGVVGIENIGVASAELAVAVRPEAMGQGYSWFGVKGIIKKAFDELGLDTIFWCIKKENLRAIRFFEKHNFCQTLDIPRDILARYKGNENIKWYSVHKGDEFKINIKDSVAGCAVIHIKTVPTADAGELSFFEASKNVPFDIKRIYYISKVPEGVRRGHHAHKKLKQLLFCPYGRIQLILENRNGREEIELCDPSVGVLICEPTWREMLWLQKDSVLCVAASEFYDPEDYIRDYDEYVRYICGER